MAQFQFDATQHASAMNFDALPKGWYQAKLIESKSRTTGSGGQALDFVAEILAPAFAKGRKVFLGYNVVNANPEAVRIGYEQLAALSLAVQTPQWQQTEQLHEKPFHLKLKIEKAEEGTDYEDRNQPNGYDPITVQRALAVQPGNAAQAPSTAAFPGAPAAPAAAPAAPFTPPAAPAPAAAPQAPAPQAAPQQPWTAPAAAAPTQPWEQPAAAPAPAAPAPAAEPQKSPEQIAWEQQQAAAAQQPVAPQPAPAAAPQAPAAPAPEAAPAAPAQAPWATQTATPAPQTAAAAPQQPAVQEPPHPAQAQVPPWQQPTA